jgi:hypothetical protein
VSRTNVEAILHLQPNRPARQATLQPLKQAPKAAAQPAKKAGARPNAGRASKKGAGPARPPRKSGEGDEGGGGNGDVAKAPALPAASSDEGAAVDARVRAEIEALPVEEARHITVHVPAAAMLALGALPKMLALREAMVAELVNPPTEALDKLHDYAQAAARAHACLLLQDDGETRVRALLVEASPLREHLLLSAELLAKMGLLDPRKVAAIRQGTGRLDTAQDLSALAALFLAAWPALGSKTPFGWADVERAAALGAHLLEALGRQQQHTDGSDEPGDLEVHYVKAYELFRRAYEACRRAIIYLRYDDGDADVIAPPLGQSRRRGRRAEADAPDGEGPDAPEPLPSGPAPVDSGGGEADAGLATLSGGPSDAEGDPRRLP